MKQLHEFWGQKPRYPETRALMEGALRHVLSGAGKNFEAARRDRSEVSLLLLAVGCPSRPTPATINLAEANFDPKGVEQLKREAEKLRRVVVDVFSENLREAKSGLKSVHIYGHCIEGSSSKAAPGRRGIISADIARAHFTTIFDYAYLSRQLAHECSPSIAILATKTERVWQQFLERHLGPPFRVLTGRPHLRP